MGDIFKDINAFVSSNIILNSPTLRKTIAIKVLEMYEKSVVQVLDSVRQIEENLKRFKRKNTLNGVSDETKVRNQIKVDVEEFFNQLKSFGVDNLEDSINTNLRKVVEESFSIQQGI